MGRGSGLRLELLGFISMSVLPLRSEELVVTQPCLKPKHGDYHTFEEYNLARILALCLAMQFILASARLFNGSISDKLKILAYHLRI